MERWVAAACLNGYYLRGEDFGINMQMEISSSRCLFKSFRQTSGQYMGVPAGQSTLPQLSPSDVSLPLP